MPARPAQSGAVVPAQLAFLAIYNPSLGNTDETLHDQIVFYWSRKFRGGRRQGNGDGDQGQDNTEEKNEKLRQIGLAQGMVEFARLAFHLLRPLVQGGNTNANSLGRSFSQNEPVNSVETEKSRIVLYELEPSWWILAVWRSPFFSAFPNYANNFTVYRSHPSTYNWEQNKTDCRFRVAQYRILSPRSQSAAAPNPTAAEGSY
jgi:hypothetical protein